MKGVNANDVAYKKAHPFQVSEFSSDAGFSRKIKKNALWKVVTGTPNYANPIRNFLHFFSVYPEI